VSFPLYFDEHVHADLAEMLLKDGYDILTSRDAGNSNRELSDTEQLAYATSQGRVLFTYNIKDFVPLAREWTEIGREYTGIIVCEQLPARELYLRLVAYLELYEEFPPGMCDHLPRLAN
jgi:predicted nuclease of predicted toxin-antitoxin system